MFTYSPAYAAEAIGTFLLVLLGNGVVASSVLRRSKGKKGGWLAITLGWGIAVMVGIYAVTRFSEAHLNPAITLALAAHGYFEWKDVLGYILGQCSGAALASLCVWGVYRPHLAATKDAGRKLSCFCTMPAIDDRFSNFFCECLATALLVFGIMSLTAHGEWLHNSLSLAAAGSSLPGFFFKSIQPLLVGILLIGLGLSLGGPTGYALNPARDFIPRLMHALLPIPGKNSSGWGYAWIPVLGPILGAYVGLYGYRLWVNLF